MGTSTFNPNALNAEDGFVARSEHATWADLHDAALGNSTSKTLISAAMWASSINNLWYSFYRGVLMFYTGSLPDSADIISATVSLYCVAKSYNGGGNSHSINIYSSGTASATNIVNGDYDSFGTTALSTAKAYNDVTLNGWNVFTLNSSGLAAISKTGVTKLSIRIVADATNSEPAWSDTYGLNTNFDAVTNVPVLTVEYGASYPTDSLTRVTGIKHVYKNKLIGTPEYKCKVQIGGLANLDQIDIWTGGEAGGKPEAMPIVPTIAPTAQSLNLPPGVTLPGTPVYAPGRLPFWANSPTTPSYFPDAPNKPIWWKPTGGDA